MSSCQAMRAVQRPSKFNSSQSCECDIETSTVDGMKILLALLLTTSAFGQARRLDLPGFGTDPRSCGEYNPHSLVRANGRYGNFGQQVDDAKRTLPLPAPIPQLRIANGEADTAGFVTYSADCKVQSQTIKAAVLQIDTTSTANGRCAKHGDAAFRNTGGDGRTNPELSTVAYLPGTENDKWTITVQYTLAFRGGTGQNGRNATCVASVSGKSGQLTLNQASGAGSGTFTAADLDPGLHSVIVSCGGSGPAGGCYGMNAPDNSGADGTAPQTERVALVITSKRQ